MFLNERFRKFPISFYKDINTSNIVYESGFTSGTAKTLEKAFEEFSRSDFARDIYYYYDDVVDVKVGRFIPALKDKITKGKQYLGKLEIELDIENVGGNKEHKVSYLSRNKDKIPNQLRYIEKMKKAEKINKIKEKIKNGITNLLSKFTKNEMFLPVKSLTDVICEHCGEIIPVGTYFEVYRNNDYHIECIWDKLINKKENNSYNEAESYFFSLQQYIGRWPGYGLDVEEDYISDLELVKANNRYLRREPMDSQLNETLDYYVRLYEAL